jgi:hypothetical protein
MLRLLIDQDFDQRILRGLQRRIPHLDFVTAHEAGLGETPDPELLAWAAEVGRVIVTHDRRTMPEHAAERIATGEIIAGVFIVPRRLPINQVIEDLEMMVTCTHKGEWENVVQYLPL